MAQVDPPALVRLSEGLGAWLPIETAPEGRHVLLWFPKGERGIGGMECGTLYFNDAAAPGGINIWTHGGPNSGSDWQLDEAPTHWMPLPAPPVRPNVELTGLSRHGGSNDETR